MAGHGSALEVGIRAARRRGTKARANKMAHEELHRLWCRLLSHCCSGYWAGECKRVVVSGQVANGDRLELRLMAQGVYPPGGELSSMVTCRKCGRPTPRHCTSIVESVCDDCMIGRGANRDPEFADVPGSIGSVIRFRR